MSRRLVAARCHRCQRNRPPARLAPTAMATRCDRAQSGMASPRVGGQQCRLSGADRHVSDKRMRSWLVEAAGPEQHRPPCDRVGDGGQRPSARAPGPPRHPMALPVVFDRLGGFRIDQQVPPGPIEKLASRASAPFATRTRYSPGRLPARQAAAGPVGSREGDARARSAGLRRAAVSPGGRVQTVSRRAPRGVSSVRRYPLPGFPSSARQRSVPAVYWTRVSSWPFR